MEAEPLSQIRCRANKCVMIYSSNIFKRQSLLKVASDSYPPQQRQKGYARIKVWKQKRKYPHLCRDASVPSVPQTHTRGRLHLIGGSPRRLVALPVRPHLQVLMDDIWSRDGKENRVRGWQMEQVWWLQQERKTLFWTLLWVVLFLSSSWLCRAEDTHKCVRV